MQIGSRAVTYNGDNVPDSIVYTKGGTDTSIDFAYDASGKRAKKSVGAGSDTYYVNELFQIKDTGGTRENTSYIFAGNLRVAMLKGGTPYYFHKDHLGSSSVLSDDTGEPVETTAYLPYGHERSHTGTDISDYRFTDQELDHGTGLYNYDARLYDPVIGMFITPDSVVPDWIDPQMLNRYAYCRNNPLIYVDPNGHEPISLTVIGTVALCSIGIDYYSKWRDSGKSFSDYYWSADYTVQRGVVVGSAGALSGGSGSLIAGTSVSLGKKMLTAALVDASIDLNKRQILGDEITAGTVISSASGGAMGQGFGHLFSYGLDSFVNKTESTLIDAGLTRTLDAFGNAMPYTKWSTEVSSAYLTGIVFGETSGQLINYNLGDTITQPIDYSIDWWGDKGNEAWDYTTDYLNYQFSGSQP